MHFAPFFLVALAHTHNTLHPGAVQESESDTPTPDADTPPPDSETSHLDRDLGFENESLVMGNVLANFEYFDTGALRSVDTGQYLSISLNGRLVPSDYPHYGFSLTVVPGFDMVRRLTYYGDESFQLCGDQSVAYDSDCEGAQIIEITYEDQPDD
ncbi:hypothetical protein JCM33374_g1678 [Metschnikowia sp. JCM 33374]|nr:hypothetical protein JCM33374_g1678 [Metschnikowia sp. JCM 33374]